MVALMAILWQSAHVHGGTGTGRATVVAGGHGSATPHRPGAAAGQPRPGKAGSGNAGSGNAGSGRAGAGKAGQAAGRSLRAPGTVTAGARPAGALTDSAPTGQAAAGSAPGAGAPSVPAPGTVPVAATGPSGSGPPTTTPSPPVSPTTTAPTTTVPATHTVATRTESFSGTVTPSQPDATVALGTDAGTVTASATWSGSADLTVALRCPGGQSERTGGSGTEVATTSEGGTCYAELAEGGGGPTVAYSLALTYQG